MVELSLEQAFMRADFHIERGEVSEARKFYQAILSAVPNNERAQQALTALQEEQSPADTQSPPQEVITQLLNLYNSGNLEAVVEQASLLTEQYPEAFVVWNILGAANKGLGDLDKASQAFKKVTKLNPSLADGFNNLGTVLKGQGKLEEAIDSFKIALALKSDYAEAYFNMGVTFREQDKLQEAIESYTKAVSLKPDHVDAFYNMGNVLQRLGKLQEAEEAYINALSLKPNYAEAYYSMGNTLIGQGRLEEAIEAFKKTLTLKPTFAEAYNNLGVIFINQGELEEAMKNCAKTLELKPNYAEAHNNMGGALQKLGRLDDAIKAFNKAILLKPNYVEPYFNIGIILKNQNKLQEAVEMHTKALLHNPDYANARSERLNLQAKICDWKAVEEDRSLLLDFGIAGDAISPFSVLALEDAPERHRLRSEKYAREHFPVKSTKQFERPSRMPKRLRIGYFSADFHNFPGMHLMVRMLERHDRSKFEIYAFSYGQEINDKMRSRLVSAVDYFIDIQSMSTDAVHKCVEEKKIDIAIHRNGYTKNSRTGLFSSRLAPVQINYLGYPGTLGADFIDYIVADPIVIPEDKRQHYSEQIMYLPHTYQPNDNTRTVSQKVQTREDMGLPSDGFVFCCFNNNYKISPKEFDIWMRLMGKVEGSVLWLLKSNKWTEHNLKREAEARGLSADRVIFAERVENSEHLARHRLADLFLDTFNYNAHTTASDALWAGLPVVTKLGKGFAARVAGSLLSAVGLPELITHDEEAYEALILKLATQPKKLDTIKKKLEVNRLSQPLFNTEQYTKHLENGYLQAYQRYFNGKEPDTIIVPE